jgi:imidazolonepropionase-like amidohydrolase
VRITDELLEDLAGRALPVGATLGAPPPQALARMPDSVKAMMDKAGVTPAMIREVRLATVRRMHQAGVQFVAGRDSGIAPHMDHGSLRESVAFLVEAGASIAQALAAATSRAAHACGVADTKGSLRPGYDADILVVDGDLSADVSRLRYVRAVLRNGRPIS